MSAIDEISFDPFLLLSNRALVMSIDLKILVEFYYQTRSLTIELDYLHISGDVLIEPRQVR